MPSNSADYQREYRKRNPSTRKYATVAMEAGEHRELQSYAKAQGLSLSTLLREATLHQARGSQMQSPAVTEELRELRFLVSNIANNVNQMAHHSNRVKSVADENGLWQNLKSLEDMIMDFTSARMKSSPQDTHAQDSGAHHSQTDSPDTEL